MTSRARLLASLVVAPAIIAAAGVVALEAWRLGAPESPLFGTPFVYSLADAIERDDVHAAYAFVRAGQDPNAPIPVRHPQLTGGRVVAVAPVVWAAATDARQTVLMLLGFGARIDAAAVCVAEELEHAEMAELLRRHGGAAPRGACLPLGRLLQSRDMSNQRNGVIFCI